MGINGFLIIQIYELLEKLKDVTVIHWASETVFAADILRGDVDGDGNITIDDVMEICKIMARHI